MGELCTAMYQMDVSLSISPCDCCVVFKPLTAIDMEVHFKDGMLTSVGDIFAIAVHQLPSLPLSLCRATPPGLLMSARKDRAMVL